ncbi:NAD-dependent epimerase/dehydratase family protein [Allorhodopirellula solitaria]|uniref:NAD dependent epimerase/dehydratase family protein n=1 Tax=Allorhodopirellula solitaria TaxID=2527987 RepID=A0A5C5YJX7_9BACT|nr:NAD(P)-dependent oxidoreductase [Allorhodopirellula solitaria]TWT75127.1 NAD dependent epimerase/dehydratase family protein [Allorhodopirellula solitaria]
MSITDSLPESFSNEAALDERLLTPSDRLIEFAASLRGPLVILGAGGKMGPSLAGRVQAAIVASGADARVVAVSRFSDPSSRDWLAARGVETISADLMEPAAISQLPDAANVVYLVGSKFGTRQNPSHTWAINTLATSHAMTRYASSNVVALSTGNVYSFSPVKSAGAVESDSLAPVGEYASAALARERILEYHSLQHGTPVMAIRLNYATDLRYGVLTDIACRVFSGQPVDLTQGYFNCIWQGDANDLIVRALGLCQSPMAVLNVTGTDVLSVREVAQTLGRLMDRPVQFTGVAAETALLSDASRCSRVLGQPETPIQTVIEWTADWVSKGQRLLNKPTHFEVRDGNF